MKGLELRDADSRYLALHSIAWGPVSPWRRFLESAGCAGALNLGLNYLVSRGWLVPSASVRLDPKSFLEWSNFPNMPMAGQFSTSEVHASALSWDLLVQGFHSYRADESSVAFRHPMDDAAWRAQQESLGVTSVDPTQLDGVQQVVHPRMPNAPFTPVVVTFPYWQAYRLEALWREARRNVVLRPDRVAQAKQDFEFALGEDAVEWLAAAENRVLRRWSTLVGVFEILSKYRTARGAISDTWELSAKCSDEALTVAAVAIVKEAGLDGDALRLLVRNELLVLASEWSLDKFPFGPCDRLRPLLQEDVALATSLISRFSGSEPDFFDEFWGEPSDRMRRRWLPLGLALPMEEYRVLRDFPGQARVYFGNAVPVPPSFPLEDLEKLFEMARTLARTSWPIMRFMVNFQRLHSHFDGSINRDNLIEARLESPLEHAQNISLQLESMLRPMSSGSAKTLKWMLLQLLKWSVETRGVTEWVSVEEAFKKVTAKLTAQQHDVPVRLTVFEPASFPELSPVPAFLLAAFLSAFSFRNYLAHRDELDSGLLMDRDAGVAVQGVLTVFLEEVRRRGFVSASTTGSCGGE